MAAAVATVGLVSLAAPALPSLPTTSEPSSVWIGQAGAITTVFVRATGHAVVGSVRFDQKTGKPRGRVALVDAGAAREIWSTEYRNRQCCIILSVGALPESGQAFASGDEIVLVSLRSGRAHRVGLNGSTVDASSDRRRVLVGTLQGEVATFDERALLWRASHPEAAAVALSDDGLAAAASRQSVAVFDARTGRRLHRIPFAETRAVDISFAPDSLLVVAQRATDGAVRLLGIDVPTGRIRWSLALGPMTLPSVATAGRQIVVADFLGRMAAVISPSGNLQRRWNDGQGRVFIAGSPEGEIALAIGRNVSVHTRRGSLRWRGVMPGAVLGLRLEGPWLAVIGTMAQNSHAPDRIWFVQTAETSTRP